MKSTGFVPIIGPAPRTRLTRVRRLALLALLLPAIAASGCGGDKGPSGPLDEGLHYLPANAPFAVAIDTEVNGGQYRTAGRIAERFPFASAAENALKKLFERGDVDFDRDGKPVLGNPFVVGGGGPRGADGGALVRAVQGKGGGKGRDRG